MSYSQLDYYYRNREKILKKNREKANELKKLNKKFNVRERKNRKPKEIELTVKHGKFLVTFD